MANKKPSTKKKTAKAKETVTEQEPVVEQESVQEPVQEIVQEQEPTTVPEGETEQESTPVQEQDVVPPTDEELLKKYEHEIRMEQLLSLWISNQRAINKVIDSNPEALEFYLREETLKSLIFDNRAKLNYPPQLILQVLGKTIDKLKQ